MAIVGVVVLVIVLLIVGADQQRRRLGLELREQRQDTPRRQTGARAHAERRDATRRAAAVVALSLRPPAPVYVCLIGDHGRKVIPGEELQAGESTLDLPCQAL